MVKLIPFLVVALLSQAQTLSYNNVGASPGVTPITFGGHGDAQSVVNGCTTTASSTSVKCPTGTFVSGDVGKQIWITGAGAAGVAFNSTIATVISNTAITVSAAPSTAVHQLYTVYGHDDVAALQSCFNYSAAHQVPCVLNTPSGYGYLEGSAGLTMAVIPLTFNGAMNVTGNSFQKGTAIFCEFNGDCLSLQPGPVQGLSLSNIEIYVDSSQPSGRGIHLNAAPGTAGAGGLFNSTLTNVQIDNPNLECLWMDGGGGVGYTYNLPNQYVTFNNFNCNGPNQMHTANLIKITGQAAQIIFEQGAVNGQYPVSKYPNPMIYLGEKTSGLGDSPTDVKFFGYTYEVGTQGMYLGEGTNNIHYDNGYIENVPSPLYAVNSRAFTFNGNHIANSGTAIAVAQFAGLVTGSMRDNYVYGTNVPAAFAVCQNNNNTIDFADNTSSVGTTTECATAQVNPASTLVVTGGQTLFVNGSATPITSISAPGISPGKTLTLYASGTITLASGGNINFGGLTSPLTLLAGQSVTLTLFDLGPTWVITSTTAVTASASIPATSNVMKGAGSAGPYSTFFDDFYSGANMASRPIGSATADTCTASNLYRDSNHPGNMLIEAGTAGTGSGIVCGLISENPSITSVNTPLAWTWETAVYVPVLPTTNPGSYQVGMAHTPNENPWTSGIGFYLSSANSPQSHWYCRYSSTSTDSHVSAVVAWTRLTMSNDGSLVHWYINGHEVCGTGVPIASLPSTTEYPALWSATALSGTSVSLAYDYINWQRVVER